MTTTEGTQEAEAREIERLTESTTLLRIATAGSVDDGKSTLIGRLLHDTKSVMADQLAAVTEASRRRGWAGELADLALLTDGLRAEREQGITIDVAHRFFATPTRSFVLADTPGHVQYTRNMVTGASRADAVIVLVDARHGIVEQTRRHLAVSALLRVGHVVVAINKIDLVEEPEQVLESVERDLAALGDVLALPPTTAVPVSALHGDNVVLRSTRTPWYEGPTLLDLLEELPPLAHEADEFFRMPVQLVIRPQQGAVDPTMQDFRGFAGLVTAGAVEVGDPIEVAASGLRSEVTAIWQAGRPVLRAETGLSVTLELADEVDVSRGDLLGAAGTLPESGDEVRAVLCWLGGSPLVPGARVLIAHGTATAAAKVTSIDGRLDIASLTRTEADRAELNDLVEVTLRLARPLPLESYTTSREGGALVVIDPQDGTTLAAGMVDGTLGS
ncbi:sulfate adenylyltransferase [Brachybacterium endophyticum]|uniref:sulfate adenylyltransferase n=1 Tax=Brachybacterium endophyticum TaxID=2182385 RepID=A0A2U2RI41_9MICO|nr:GTP-binding protein [Brachybacterium endophyticum]PWH05435.1 sulfate adenylyltransferase [Brachybacterium endophyticum]